MKQPHRNYLVVAACALGYVALVLLIVWMVGCQQDGYRDLGQKRTGKLPIRSIGVGETALAKKSAQLFQRGSSHRAEERRLALLTRYTRSQCSEKRAFAHELPAYEDAWP
jgi:hypothetical protein